MEKVIIIFMVGGVFVRMLRILQFYKFVILIILLMKLMKMLFGIQMLSWRET